MTFEKLPRYMVYQTLPSQKSIVRQCETAIVRQERKIRTWFSFLSKSFPTDDEMIIIDAT